VPALHLMFMESENTGKIASIGTAASGVLCAVGWYTFIGFLLEASNQPTVDGVKSGAYWAPGILMSLGLVMLNIIKWEAVTDDGGLGGDGPGVKAKAWVTVAFVIMFCALGGAAWILVQDLQDHNTEWKGAAWGVLIQNLCIFFAGLLFRIVRRHGDHDF